MGITTVQRIVVV